MRFDRLSVISFAKKVYCCVLASIALEPVLMIARFEGFPQVQQRERAGFLKLLDVPQFVQEELDRRLAAFTEEDGAPEGDPGNGALAEAEARNSGDEPTAAPVHPGELWVPLEGQFGQGLRGSDDRLD